MRLRFVVPAFWQKGLPAMRLPIICLCAAILYCSTAQAVDGEPAPVRLDVDQWWRAEHAELQLHIAARASSKVKDSEVVRREAMVHRRPEQALCAAGRGAAMSPAQRRRDVLNTADKHDHPRRSMSAAEKPKTKENPMKPTLLSMLTSTLLVSAAMAGESGPSAIAPAGGNGQPPYSWRGINGSGVFPAKDLVSEFWDIAPDVVTSVKDAKGVERKLTLPGAPGSRKNIVWRTTLPHWGQNTPVAVQDRVFVLCQEGWKSDAPLLVCLDVKDGKILWQQPVDHLDAWPTDKATVAKETRAKHLRYWREAMTWWNRLFWDNTANTFSSRLAAEFDALAAQAKQAGYDWGKFANREQVEGKEVVRARRGVSGGYRGRYYWRVGTEEMQQTYEACAKNRYHWYPGWTSEGPFFGSCMGSVVSDGNRIYAVTALDGAACFDLDGKRLWVADLEGKQMQHYPASASRNHNNMASPVLAGGKLIYYHYGAVESIALDAQTGRLAWRTPAPIKAGKPGFFRVAGTPIGYGSGGYGSGHMAPGGTPVVMVLGTTPVVVSGHGMVCRIADGKFLGQVGFPAELAKKSKSDDADTAVTAPEKGLVYASDYPSWVAQGDTLYAVALGRLIAVRLGLKGDALTQEMAWNVDAVSTGMGGGSNPVIGSDPLLTSGWEAPGRQSVGRCHGPNPGQRSE